MFPVKPVEHPVAFAIKVFAAVVIANAIGALLYLLRGKQTAA